MEEPEAGIVVGGGLGGIGGAVVGIVVEDEQLEVRVILLEEGGDGSGDDAGFVAGGDEDSHGRALRVVISRHGRKTATGRQEAACWWQWRTQAREGARIGGGDHKDHGQGGRDQQRREGCQRET